MLPVIKQIVIICVRGTSLQAEGRTAGDGETVFVVQRHFRCHIICLNHRSTSRGTTPTGVVQELLQATDVVVRVLGTNILDTAGTGVGHDGRSATGLVSRAAGPLFLRRRAVVPTVAHGELVSDLMSHDAHGDANDGAAYTSHPTRFTISTGSTAYYATKAVITTGRKNVAEVISGGRDAGYGEGISYLR